MTKFKQFEKYPTRNGGTALILNVGMSLLSVAFYDAAGNYDGEGFALLDGSAFPGRLDSAWGILAPEPEKRTVWVNVCRDNSGALFIGGIADNHQIAGTLAAYISTDRSKERVGCHRITLRAEFESEEDAP